MHYILDDNGDPVGPVDWRTWAEWFSTADRVAARTEVGDAVVSTVFLSLDHAFMGGPPILYETMIFGGKHKEAQWRYRNRWEALAHHDQIVAALRRGDELPS